MFLAVNNAGEPEESTLQIVSPKDGAYIAGMAEFSIAALDNVAFKTVELYINGNQIGSLALPPYKFQINTKDYPDGEYSILARGSDFSGNIKENSIKVKISNDDITKAKPNDTVTGLNYRENIQAAATMLNAQIGKLEFKLKNNSADNNERTKAVKGTVKSLSGIMKKHKKDLAADKSLSKIEKLAKALIKKANDLLKAKKEDNFAQNKKTIMPILKKLTLAFGKI